MYNGKVFAAFSRKLDKYGVLDKLPCYRLSIDNKIPYLGSFAYSPIYFFLKKVDGKVTEVAILDIPVKFESFKNQILEYSGLRKELEKIDVVPKFQVKYHFQLTDIEPGFEIDRDLLDRIEELKEEAIIEAEKAKAKIEEEKVNEEAAKVEAAKAEEVKVEAEEVKIEAEKVEAEKVEADIALEESKPETTPPTTSEN
jgi:hypothetical protein